MCINRCAVSEKQKHLSYFNLLLQLRVNYSATLTYVGYAYLYRLCLLISVMLTYVGYAYLCRL